VLSVPLGALADAYLDALASLEGDRMGKRVRLRVDRQPLILIKSRALLAETLGRGCRAAGRRGPGPEAELRARLILYRAFRNAGADLIAVAQARVGLFHREATAAHAAGLAGARPPAAEPLSPALLVAALDGLARVAPPPPPPPETIPRSITLTQRAAIIRRAPGRPVIVSRTCCAGP